MARKATTTTITDEDGNPVVIDLSTTQKPSTSLNGSVLVKVKSNCYGTLVYRSKRSGETTTWEHVGDVQLMTIDELRTMKGEQPAFYKNQWIIIIGAAEATEEEIPCSDIYVYLGITKYYQNIVEPTDYARILSWTEKEIEEKVKMFTPAVKTNLIVALNKYIEDGKLDSLKKIKAFEKALNCELHAIN